MLARLRRGRAEKPCSATTVDEIAERAGVAKGTVYYNFKSKTE
ncbi:helix-turn-helix domain-containing protein, partial [Streptomyces tanashiensis]